MSDTRRSPRTIFLEAIEKTSPEELARYLAEACGDDAPLRDQVDALLRAHERAGRFLGGSFASDSTVSLPPVSEQPGMQIGPYKLRERLGEGGMGVVFVAEQKDPVKRRVALKIIKPGMDTREVIARFEAERQALAMMDHPNIARVLDAGQTDSGHPFFAMELVNGLPITDYCDQQRLSLRERLELFIPVCHAVQHAHQKGIIHRDLKPSNVLVAMYDGEPVPKVIDFGVAKATSQTLTEKTIYTQLGQVVGTLEYMSPEQAQRNQLDIDTRSDVYSLGVILYELLTGETPIDRQRLQSAAFDEILRIIRDEEPPRPSTKLNSSQTLPAIAANRRVEPKRLSTLVRGELDWIVMKALEKKRSRRYDTANALAADISNYLNDAPVMACPPSATYQLQKFLRRYKELAATTALVVAALLVGIVTTSWQGWVARRERDRAVIAEGMADDRLVAEQSARAAEAKARAETERALADRRESLVRLYVRTGTEHVDRGDHTRALPWFLKAFELEQDDPERAKIHRLRIAMTLDRCPKLTHVLWPDHDVDQIQFFADGRRVLLTGGRQASVWDIQQGVSIDFPLDGRYHRLGPLGQRIVVFRDPGRVLVLDGQSSEVICRLPRGPGRPTFAGFSQDSTKLFVVYGNRKLRVWDPDTGKPLSPVLEEPVERIVGATFNSDARYLIASDNQPRFPDIVLVWDLESNQVVQRIPVAHGFSGNYAEYIVAGLDWFAVPSDAFVFVAPLPNGNGPQTWLQHSDQVRTLRISEDARMLLSSSIDNTVRVWNPRSRSPRTDYLKLDASIYAADFSPDGRSVAAGAVDGRVAHWRVNDGQLASPTLQHPDRIRAIRFGRQNRQMLTASKNGGVRVWDLAAAVAAPELEREQSYGAEAHAAFGDDGQRLVVSFVDYSAQIYDLATKAYIKPLIEHHDLNTLTCLDPAKKRIYSVCRSGEIVGADLEKGAILFRNDLPVLPPVGVKGEPVSITTRGRPYRFAQTMLDHDQTRNVLYAATRYATSEGNPNVSRLYVLHADTGELVCEPLRFQRPISATRITRDGNYWVGAFAGHASGTPGYRVEIRGLPDLVLERAIPVQTPPWDFDISQDGTRLLIGIGHPFSGGGVAQVFDLGTGQPVTPPMRHRGTVKNCRFLDHDRLVLTNDQEGSLRLWHSDTAKPAAPAIRVGRWVRSLGVDPNELWIAGGTGGNDDDGIAEQFLQLWDIRTGQRIAPPISHSDSVMSLDISPAGDRIATASRDRYARVFRIPQEDRSWEELSSLVELIAGIQIDSSETPVRVTASAFRQLWDEFQDRYPQEFETTVPEQVAWFRSRFDSLRRGGYRESAKETLDRLIQLDPNDPYLYRRRIELCRLLRLWDTVQTDIETVARMEGLRGRKLAKLAAETTWGTSYGPDFERFVLKILDRAARMSPDDPYPFRYRALLHRNRFDYAAAKSDLLRAIELVPGDFWPHAELAQIQLYEGNREAYTKTCQRILDSITPTNMSFIEEAVVWACCLGDVAFEERELLIERAEFAADTRPSSMRYQVLLGTAYLRDGRYEEAYAHFKRADQLPDDAQNAWFSSPIDRYYLLAIACHHLGRLEEACDWFEKALAARVLSMPEPYTTTILRREFDRIELTSEPSVASLQTLVQRAALYHKHWRGNGAEPLLQRAVWQARQIAARRSADRGEQPDAEASYHAVLAESLDDAQLELARRYILTQQAKRFVAEGEVVKAAEIYGELYKDRDTLWNWKNLIQNHCWRGGDTETLRQIMAIAESNLDEPLVMDLKFTQAGWELILGRVSEYERICRELVDRVRAMEDPQDQFLVARLAALSEQPAIDTGLLVEMAMAPHLSGRVYEQANAQGLALLRDGQPQAAIERLLERSVHPWNWVALALAYHAAGQPEKATKWLETSQKYFTERPPLQSPVSQDNRIVCHLLLQEAHRKMHPTEETSPQQASPETSATE